MTKTTTAGMDTHLGQEVTSLATCWRITRTDAVEFFFTDHDKDIVFDGNRYEADTGYKRTAIENDSSMSVDNLDIEGIFSSEQITEQDLRAGIFDFAQIRIFIVNWDDLVDGDIKMRNGRLGEVTLTEQGVFRAELRGLTQALSQRVGEVYQPECRVDLGDSKCQVPVKPPLRVDSTGYLVGDYIRVATTTSTIPPIVKLLVPADVDADGVGLFPATGTVGSEAAQQGIIKKFGAGAIEFTPTVAVTPSASFVSYPDNIQYALGANDHTIETWVQFKDLTTTLQVIMAQYDTTGNQRAWFIRRNGNLLDAAYSDDGTASAPFFTFSGAFTWAINTWYHVAMTRAGNVFRLFVDGVIVGTTTSSIAIHNSTSPLHLGKLLASGGDQPMDGFVDDSRITVGLALYTQNFTPPIAPHPTDNASADNQDIFENRIYECTTAGTSDVSEPTFDTIVGNTTTDGTAVFTAREAWTRNAFVATVTDRTNLTLDSATLVESRAVNGWFNGGAVIFDDGNNAGKVIEIKEWTQTGEILKLFLPAAFDIIPGTSLSIYPGCDKRTTTCINKFVIPGSLDFAAGNIVNFRGDPFIPGRDELVRYPDGKSA